MKKRLFALILPLAAMTLAGCVKYNGKNKDGSPKSTSHHTPTDTQAPTDTSTPVTPGVDVTYYLNVGKYGYIQETPDEKIEGGKIPSANLEHGIAKSGKSGDALYTAKKVKSKLYGVEFKHWVLSGSQNIYTQVPDISGCTLVAVFGPINEYTRTKFDHEIGYDAPEFGFGIKFGDDTFYVGTRCENEPFTDRLQYCIHKAYFLKGETFQLWDFGNGVGWANNDVIDPYSCGGTSGSSTNWLDYFRADDGKFKVQKDFTSDEIYLKFAPAPLGDLVWFK